MTLHWTALVAFVVLCFPVSIGAFVLGMATSFKMNAGDNLYQWYKRRNREQ